MAAEACTPDIPGEEGEEDDDRHEDGADVVGERLDGRLGQLRRLHQRHNLRQCRVLAHPRSLHVQRPALQVERPKRE